MGNPALYYYWLHREGAAAIRPEIEKYPGYLLEENFKKALTEVLILSVLAEKECYIGELADVIAARSKDTLTIIFPYSAVYRLEEAGYIYEVAKRTAPDGRRRQYLGITSEGKERLELLKETYCRISRGAQDVLKGGAVDGTSE